MARTSRAEKGKAPSTSGRMETAPSPRTPAGRFQQYTPLVAAIDQVFAQVSGRGLLRNPRPLQTDRSKRDATKYCHFHKDIGHDTKDCIQLRDQIERLVRDGHLREFVEKVITPVCAPSTQ